MAFLSTSTKKDYTSPNNNDNTKKDNKKEEFLMNNVNVTGKIMQLTINKEEQALGTISVFRGYKKDDNSPIYDYLSFILFGNQVSRLNKGSIVGLSGHLQSYQKDVGKEYPETLIQIFVEKLDTFDGNKVNKSEDAKGNPFEQKDDGLNIDDSMLPDNMFGGNN